MTREVTRLAGHIEGLIDLGKALLVASKQKTEALAAMDLDRITRLTEEETELAERFGAARDAFRDAVAGSLGVEPASSGHDPAHDASLGRLIERTDEPLRSKLTVLRKALADVMKEVEFANVTNGIVSKRSLRHFRDMLGLLSGAGKTDDRYTSAGRLSQRLGPSRLVNQIA